MRVLMLLVVVALSSTARAEESPLCSEVAALARASAPTTRLMGTVESAPTVTDEDIACLERAQVPALVVEVARARQSALRGDNQGSGVTEGDVTDVPSLAEALGQLAPQPVPIPVRQSVRPISDPCSDQRLRISLPDPAAAGLLSAIGGFGAGHFYVGDGRGAPFLVTQGLGLAAVGIGNLLAPDVSSGSTSDQIQALNKKATIWGGVALGGGALFIISRTADIASAPRAAREVAMEHLDQCRP